VRPGQRSGLIYRTRVRRGSKGERRSFAEADYAALLDAAHQQLGGPIVVIWDNLNVRHEAPLRAGRGCKGPATGLSQQGW
jgi:putative transposase